MLFIVLSGKYKKIFLQDRLMGIVIWGVTDGGAPGSWCHMPPMKTQVLLIAHGRWGCNYRFCIRAKGPVFRIIQLAH